MIIILCKFPIFLFASIQEVAGLPEAKVNVAAIGTLHQVSCVLAPGRDAVLAYAAFTTVNLVLQQVVEEHLRAVFAKVVLVHNVRAVGEASVGTAKSGNLLDLFVIFALALQENSSS